MTAPDLLPCPFCGGHVSATRLSSNDERTGYRGTCLITCMSCAARLSATDTMDANGWSNTSPELTMARAIAAWNRRAGLQAIVNNAVLTAVDAMGGGMGDVNKLRLKAFKSNSVDDLSDYFQAAAMWFQQHEDRVIDAINKAKVPE